MGAYFPNFVAIRIHSQAHVRDSPSFFLHCISKPMQTARVHWKQKLRCGFWAPLFCCCCWFSLFNTIFAKFIHDHRSGVRARTTQVKQFKFFRYFIYSRAAMDGFLWVNCIALHCLVCTHRWEIKVNVVNFNDLAVNHTTLSNTHKIHRNV